MRTQVEHLIARCPRDAERDRLPGPVNQPRTPKTTVWWPPLDPIRYNEPIWPAGQRDG